MVRVIIYGPECFGIQTTNNLIVFNPHQDLQESQIIPWGSVTVVFGKEENVELYIKDYDFGLYSLTETYTDNALCRFVPLDGARSIFVEERHILYWHDTSLRLLCDWSPTVILVDMVQENKTIIDTIIGIWPRYAVPLHVSSDMQAIEFCRAIMQWSKCVPKYFKPGQYLLCDL